MNAITFLLVGLAAGAGDGWASTNASPQPFQTANPPRYQAPFDGRTSLPANRTTFTGPEIPQYSHANVYITQPLDDLPDRPRIDTIPFADRSQLGWNNRRGFDTATNRNLNNGAFQSGFSPGANTNFNGVNNTGLGNSGLGTPGLSSTPMGQVNTYGQTPTVAPTQPFGQNATTFGSTNSGGFNTGINGAGMNSPGLNGTPNNGYSNAPFSNQPPLQGPSNGLANNWNNGSTYGSNSIGFGNNNNGFQNGTFQNSSGNSRWQDPVPDLVQIPRNNGFNNTNTYGNNGFGNNPNNNGGFNSFNGNANSNMPIPYRSNDAFPGNNTFGNTSYNPGTNYNNGQQRPLNPPFNPPLNPMDSHDRFGDTNYNQNFPSFNQNNRIADARNNSTFPPLANDLNRLRPMIPTASISKNGTQPGFTNTFASLLLFASLGGNIYLGWLARDFYWRYRDLAWEARGRSSAD